MNELIQVPDLSKLLTATCFCRVVSATVTVSVPAKGFESVVGLTPHRTEVGVTVEFLHYQKSTSGNHELESLCCQVEKYVKIGV